MKKTSIIVFFLIAILNGLKAQGRLEAYIREGLENNESIREQNFRLDKNLYALKEAKALFIPSVSFNATYTLADGGRSFDFPAGDMLNPVYSTLNKLTGSSSFPELQNQHFLLNPDNFYDTRFEVTYPLLNAEIIYNKKIKAGEFDLQKTSVDIYRRELVNDIKNAYFKYLQSDKAVRIYEEALVLTKENLRINTALFDNHMANRTAVVRSNTEVVKINTRLEEARQSEKTARAYFNFLLNRPLDAGIVFDTISKVPSLQILTDTSVSKREELIKLSTAKTINDNLIGLAGSDKIPKVNLFLNAGAQDFDFKMNHSSLYYLGGVSLNWNIFAGGKNTFKVRQAKADAMALQSQTSYVEKQLQMQIQVAVNNFNTALSAYSAARSQVSLTEQNYSDILKLYKEGKVLYIELLDAQNQLLQAKILADISLYDTWIRQAEFERANASYNIQ